MNGFNPVSTLFLRTPLFERAAALPNPVAPILEPPALAERQQRLDIAYDFARLTGSPNPQQTAQHAVIAFVSNGCEDPAPIDIRERRIQKTLTDLFGHEGFRPGQRETIGAILKGRDTFTIFPTGAGKSLCYQLPAAIFAPDLTIVVSPLIALMNDQVGKLTARGIAAACVHSNMPASEQRAAYQGVKSGRIHLLYVSPEQLGSVRFFQNVGGRKVALLAVDEAHCISTWGHDFRPSYQLIRRARITLGDPPIALITATAPPHTRRDIRSIVGFTDGFENFMTSLRPNLSFSVETFHREGPKLTRLHDLLREKAGSTIVYCTTRRIVEELSLFFTKAGVEHVAYHGQMDVSDKNAAERAFLENRSPTILCTNAFGMGIDKPDVRRIIHFQIPGSIEDYYQQVGRAGRDGKPSHGILLFSEEDIRIQTGFVIRSNPEAGFVKLVYERVKAFALKVPALQGGRPATHAQLLKNVEAQFAAKLDDRLQQMALAAFGMLVEYGHIGIDEEAVTFPGPEGKTAITDQLIREKRSRAYRKLDAMLAYARNCGGDSPSEFIRHYLDESTEEILSSFPSTEAEIDKNVYASLSSYSGSARQHAMLLSGNGNCSEESKKHHLFRSLVFMGQGEIEFMLDLMEQRGLVVSERIKGSKSPLIRLTSTGLAYATSHGLLTA